MLLEGTLLAILPDGPDTLSDAAALAEEEDTVVT
jgi:hypothetical protein